METSFGKPRGVGGFDGRADFSGDCLVNGVDFNILKGNFGLGGASPLRPIRPVPATPVPGSPTSNPTPKAPKAPNAQALPTEGKSESETASLLVAERVAVYRPSLSNQHNQQSLASVPSVPSGPSGPASPHTTPTPVLVYFHTDHLGSVGMVTDSTGAVVGRQEFDPWGKVRSGGATQTTLNYTGQKLDGTGLLYYHARYYDPSLAKFMSPDSIVPGASLGAGGAGGTVGQDQNSRLTVDFHESGFASSGNGENAQIVQKGFWFQLSNDNQQRAKAPWGPGNSQALNRYTYVLDNPIRYEDPVGHNAVDDMLDCGRQVSGDFPETAGPNEVLYKVDPTTGQLAGYEVYDEAGRPVKRVDLIGKDHGPYKTPHVQEYDRNTDHAGKTWVNKGKVRSAEPDELPSRMPGGAKKNLGGNEPPPSSEEQGERSYRPYPEGDLPPYEGGRGVSPRGFPGIPDMHCWFMPMVY